MLPFFSFSFFLSFEIPFSFFFFLLGWTKESRVWWERWKWKPNVIDMNSDSILGWEIICRSKREWDFVLISKNWTNVVSFYSLKKQFQRLRLVSFLIKENENNPFFFFCFKNKSFFFSFGRKCGFSFYGVVQSLFCSFLKEKSIMSWWKSGHNLSYHGDISNDLEFVTKIVRMVPWFSPGHQSPTLS